MKIEKPTGRLLTIFITGDDPRSLRTVELDNWSGMAVMGRAPYFKKALQRDELGRSCVYFLIQSAGADDIPEVYVGESDDFVQRYATAKFPITFDTFVVFTNKDDKLTRAHVKWLELKAWETLSANEGNVTVANKAKPTGSKLPEADTASMYTFMGNMTYVLEALGFEFFGVGEQVEPETKVGAGAATATPLITGSFFTTTLPKSDSAKAYMEASGDSYVLKAGSMISKAPTDSLPANLKKLRDQLISENALVDEGGPCLTLKKDISFGKPSPASALVKGRSSTGYVEWLRVTDKKKLGEILVGP
ncbi:MAG TPA: DUF4357 domain-containing protein [Vineibacter sp.]|nr:DUF4357 domain-containing protein [Vineibacter sp.]